MTAALAIPQASPASIHPVPERAAQSDFVLYGITALLMFAPLAFGAVQPWAIWTLQSASIILLMIWATRQVQSGQFAFTLSPLSAPIIAFAALVIVQVLFSSAYRHATYSQLLIYVAYGTVCFLISQTLTRTTQVRNLTTAFVIYGACLAMFAVLQSLTSPEKLYWIKAPTFSGWIYGPYVNHNHYAGLMEMLVPVPLVFAFSRYAHGRRRWLAASVAAFMGATIFLSGSRGGMAAFAVEITIFFYFLFRERKQNRVGMLLCGFLLLASIAVAWIGGNEVSARLATLEPVKHSDLSTDIRLQIYADSFRMMTKRPILGWGLGTFPDVYPQFRSFYTNLFVNHAHNDYLQMFSETGVLGLAITIWFLLVTIRAAVLKSRNWPSDVNGAVSVSALLGIAGILVHGLVDSNLQIPANAMMFYVLCTVAATEPRFRNHRREPQWRSAREETTVENMTRNHLLCS